jgi:serine/threonine protein kinase
MESPFCIVTEFYKKGSLRSVLVANETIAPVVVLEIIRGIARGINHLHRMSLPLITCNVFLEELIIHRDVAARNVLLSETYQAKIR